MLRDRINAVLGRTSELPKSPENRHWREVSEISSLDFGNLFRWFEEDPKDSKCYVPRDSAHFKRYEQYRWFLHREKHVLINGITCLGDTWMVSVWVEDSGSVQKIRMPAPQIPKKFFSGRNLDQRQAAHAA